jgi:tripartite-type tricarboxylate transporter receptor subunit TctC
MPALAGRARAVDYPARPVRVIVGAVPGSAPDVIARLAADWLSRKLGQTFFVDNRNGASGAIAAEAVAGAAPDGYTLLLVSASDSINATLFHHLKFDFLQDFVPIAGLVGFPMVITVSSKFQAKTLPELIAYAKAHPGKLNIGTPPVGSPQHVAGELFNMMSGTDILFVAYRGGPQAITDALSGQVQGAVGTVLLTIEQIRSGGLRPLAVTSAARSALLPNVPTVSSFVPGFEASQWIGLVAPKKTPPEIVERINQEVQLAFGDAEMKTKIANLGGTALPGSAAAFGQFTASEVAKWAKVINFAHIKVE